MTIQNDLDILYNEQHNRWTAEHDERIKQQTPINRRKAIVAEIKNEPEVNLNIRGLAGFVMCIPRVDMMMKLHLIENVIYKRVGA